MVVRNMLIIQRLASKCGESGIADCPGECAGGVDEVQSGIHMQEILSDG